MSEAIALVAPEVVTIVEREFRFVPATALPRSAVTVPSWRGHAVRPLPPERQVNTYLDTPTQALARAGVSFRRRVLPDRAELTLKRPRLADADHLFARTEHTEPIGADEPLAGHPLLALAAHYAPGEPIGEWFRFQTERAGVALSRGPTVIHLTWDRLTLPDDPAFVDEEIEAELTRGPLADLLALRDDLTRTYGLRPGEDGKRTRVGRYLAGRGVIAFPGVEPVAGMAGG